MKTITFKQVLSLLLVALLLITAVSCANDNNTQPPVGDGGTQGTTTGTPDNGGEEVEPPHATYGGQLVNVYTWEPFTTEFVLTEEDSYFNKVSQALWERDLCVEEKLDVEINYLVSRGAESKTEAFINELEASVMVGDGAYDYVIQYNNNAGAATLRGLYMNLAQNEEISLEADYWTPRLTECIALGEKVYFATGDIVTTITKNVYCMHYNKNMINARDLENPYDLVKSNQWTWEKLFQMSKDIYVDTDADEKKDDYSEWDDTYGLVIAGQGPIDAMYLSAGMTLIEKDAEGYYSVSPDYRGDRASSFMSFVREFRTSNDCCYANTGSFVNFPDGKSLFAIGVLDYVSKVVDAGIIKSGVAPLPKYTTDQEGYYANHANNYSMVSVPFDCPDFEIAGAVMEFLAKEGQKSVTPALFEQTFKLQYADSPEDAYMYDQVRASMTYDPGLIYVSTFQFGFAKCVIGTKEWGSTSLEIASKTETDLIPILEGLAGLKR